MVTTTSLKVGESLTIGLYFNNNYQLPTTCNLIVFIGGVCVGNLFTQEPEIERVGIYYTIRLSSQDTSKMRGYRDLIVVLDDPDGFGNKKFIVGGILFDRMADEFITTSEHQGYNMLIGMTVDESIVSGNVELIEAIKGDSAFTVWQKQAGNQGKTYDDYIAYLREPMTQAIAEGEQTMAEWAMVEAERVAEELIRKDDEEERRAAEVIREQVKVSTIAAKNEAIQATSDANNAASLANSKADLANDAATLANSKAGLADSAATNANSKADLAVTATTNANDAASLANSKAGIAQTAADNANTKADLANNAATNANAAAILANEINDRIPIIIYLSENEYQVLIDNDLVLPNVQYNIYE